MSVSIKIVPLQNSLHMFGDPDRSSAYSLSGHVQITLSPHFLSRKPAKILLQSLELTFEGQSEVAAPLVGYSAVRLCAITRELVPHDHPVLLSNDGDECPGEPCRWNAIFNINVPGWLPASSCFGTDDSGVSYQLFARAKYVDVDNRKRDVSFHHRTSSSSSSWSLSSIYSAICSSQRTATADESVSIKRFSGLPSEDALEPAPLITYLLSGDKVTTSSSDKVQSIPADVLSKIRILASVPEYLNIEENRAALTLRLRTKDLPAEECQRLQLIGFRVDILQKDKCRSQPSREYKSRYPLPAEELQPPNLPLRWTQRSPLSMDYFPHSRNPNASCSRTFSLLPPNEDGQYLLQNDNYIFANDTEQTAMPTWYTLQTNIPVMPRVPGDDEDDSNEWAGEQILRVSNTAGPLITVRHEIKVSLLLSYDIPDSTQRVNQSLTFSLPVRFASPAPHISNGRRQLCALFKSSVLSPCSSPSSSRPTTPVDAVDVITTESDLQSDDPDVALNDHSDLASLPMLPPYSLLYYSNGDRKIDPTPLPLYTPRDAPDNDSVEPSNSSHQHSIDVVPGVPLFTQKVCDVA
ncbi:hypothetical protein F5050DRAFT_1040226 [Lentinula boryana]|uniref:Arrestin-like N-terminal domain-containing protein n=1 Tax=Lentinula boryana TaxID=40481 RepID=A0ABQ8QL79_9AGAR|nr:hypothetical protein F5050DRAFT_1040226 [Lentinula boryana]